MTLYEIVTKLNGPIYSVGCSHQDVERLDNLRNILELVDKLLVDIEVASQTCDRPEHSMQVIGKEANGFLQEVVSSLSKKEITNV